jgi:hypothetical protein
MAETIEMGGVGVADETDVKEEVRKCPAPKCGKPWKLTEPTLGAVRAAILEVLSNPAYEQTLHRINPRAEFGYGGSVARGTVGNPRKDHYGFEPDVRGECGVKYDVDGFIINSRLYRDTKPNKWKRRWGGRNAQVRPLESRMRAALNARPELVHMKPGQDGFGILIVKFSDKQKQLEKVSGIMIIPAEASPSDD